MRLQVGGVTLLCHVHSGLETCPECEPGLVAAAAAAAAAPSAPAREDLQKARKRELKKIRSKFGLESAEPDLSVTKKPGYQVPSPYNKKKCSDNVSCKFWKT